MKIIFLGTGGSLPTKERGLTSIAIRRKGELLLFDCGEGTQRQMAWTEISPMNVDTIFITHFHGDHFLGIPGLVQTMSLMDRERKLKIFGPSKTKERVSQLLQTPIFTQKFEVEIRELEPGEKIDREEYFIETAEPDHSVNEIAYSLTEKELPGKFYPEKAKNLGLEPGPKYSQLQQGESVKLSDGTVIKPEQVLGPKRPGRKIVYTGDTRPSENIQDFAKGADVLIHEATFESDLEEEAEVAGHSTAEGAARIAKEAGVRRLFLIHASPRYHDLSELEEEAKEVFPNTVFAEDLMEVEVDLRDREAQKES